MYSKEEKLELEALPKLYSCGVNILQYQQTYYRYDLFNNFLSYNLGNWTIKMSLPIKEETQVLPESGFTEIQNRALTNKRKCYTFDGLECKVGCDSKMRCPVDGGWKHCIKCYGPPPTAPKKKKTNKPICYTFDRLVCKVGCNSKMRCPVDGGWKLCTYCEAPPKTTTTPTPRTTTGRDWASIETVPFNGTEGAEMIVKSTDAERTKTLLHHSSPLVLGE